jgi:hypothetical protein
MADLLLLVIPAKAGIQGFHVGAALSLARASRQAWRRPALAKKRTPWIPACAGMTGMTGIFRSGA